MSEFVQLELMLMQYAAGALGPAESLVIAAHMALSPSARHKVAHYEAEGGRMINEAAPVAVTQACLTALLEKIESGDPTLLESEDCTQRKARLQKTLPLPEPLLSLLSGCCAEDTLCWQQLGAGLERMNIHLAQAVGTDTRTLRFIRMAPGQATPLHRHHGREITLVLEGGFSDPSGHYAKGDILIINDPQYVHSTKADTSGCLCLTLTEAPLYFSSPFKRLMNLFWRL